MKFWAPLAVLAMSIAFGQKITIESDTSADFSRYKTFRMMEGQLNAKGPTLNNELVRKKIEDEIRKRLVEKGLKEVSDQPDLNARFNFSAPRRNEVNTYPAGRLGAATRREKVQYTDGTLVIDLRDTSRRALVFHSIAVQSVDDPAKLLDRLDDMVKKSIEKYPAKKK